MSDQPAFSRFVALDEHDAPALLARMSKHDLHVDGERYGVFTRLIARPAVTPADLGVAVLQKLLRACRVPAGGLGAVVVSSRTFGVEQVAGEIVRRAGLDCPGHGIERACSGFPAATEVGLGLCRELGRPVAIVTSEVLSTSINWEAADGDLEDHRRARGQASKLFGDGAAAVLILPAGEGGVFEILDAWSGEVPDDKQLIQKTAVENAIDPWGQTRPGASDCMSMPGRRGFLLVRRAPLLLAAIRGAEYVGVLLIPGSVPTQPVSDLRRAPAILAVGMAGIAGIGHAQAFGQVRPGNPETVVAAGIDHHISS